jgi:hypothetical protein
MSFTNLLNRETALKEMRQGTPASSSVSSSYFTLVFSPHAKWK